MILVRTILLEISCLQAGHHIDPHLPTIMTDQKRRQYDMRIPNNNFLYCCTVAWTISFWCEDQCKQKHIHRLLCILLISVAYSTQFLVEVTINYLIIRTISRAYGLLEQRSANSCKATTQELPLGLTYESTAHQLPLGLSWGLTLRLTWVYDPPDRPAYQCSQQINDQNAWLA